MLSKGLRLTGLLTAMAITGAVSAQEGQESAFDLSSVSGAYVASLSGFALIDPTDPLQYVPIAGLVRYCADGTGNAEVTITQNTSGVCVYRQAGTATYTVDPEGTGVVTADVTNTEVGPGCAQLNPPVVQGMRAIFELEHAIDQNGNQQVLATSLRVPMGPDTSAVIPVVLQGEAVRQGDCSLENASSQ